MPDPKQQPDSPNHDDFDLEWEQERPFWEAYQRGEYTPADYLPLAKWLDESPEVRDAMDPKIVECIMREHTDAN